jgi:interferon-induced transmembrane protein
LSDQGSTLPPPDPERPYGQPPQPGYGYAPPPGYGHPGGEPPPNYLVWAILSTVLCCLPLGVASIVFAAQVNTKWAAGDVAGARASSDKAKKFAIWSAVVTLVGALLYIALVIAIAVTGD